MKRAALYLRVSTLVQNPENQLQDLQQLAQQRGWTVVQHYQDHGISGARTRRPALDQLLADAQTAATSMWSRFGPVIAWHVRRGTFSKCWTDSITSTSSS